MGLLGGGNKTESRTDIKNTDNRVAASENAIVAAAGATITFQDPGIVSVLGDLEKDAFGVVDAAFASVSSANMQSQKTALQALDLAKARTGSATDRITDLLGPSLIVIGILGGLYIWKIS